eukprot:4884992-Lingulodinium_polyedra.AAC.1
MRAAPAISLVHDALLAAVLRGAVSKLRKTAQVSRMLRASSYLKVATSLRLTSGTQVPGRSRESL